QTTSKLQNPNSKQTSRRLEFGFWNLFGICCLGIGICSCLYADTIVLKNGRRISAESVSEEGDKVFYEAQGGRISLPKSLVERIERDEAQPAPRAPGRNAPGEAFAKALSIQISVPQKDVEGVIRGDAVDENRLHTLGVLAEQGDLERQTAVNAYLVAAAFESRRQRLAQASRWAEEALRLSGQ